MSTNNDGWIKASERKATDDDLPVWVCDRGGPRHLFAGCLPGDVWEYWKPAAADIPAPPKEETQREKDEAGFNQFWAKPTNPPPFGNDVWRAALAYERAEVAKLLPAVGQYERPVPALNAIEAIRARCGGAK